MTWFIIEKYQGNIGQYTYSIVYQEEYQNAQAMYEYNYGKSPSSEYLWISSTSPTGYNDGTAYVDSNGNILWGSSAVGGGVNVPNTPTEGGIFEEQYLIWVEMPSSVVNVIDTSFGRRILREYMNKQGWEMLYTVGKGNGIEIYAYPTGTAPIIYVAIGLLALIFAVIGTYFLKYTVTAVSNNKVIAAAEATEKEVAARLGDIAGDETLPEEVRIAAANKLIELSGGVVTQPAVTPNLPNPAGGGAAIGAGTVIALLGAAYLLSKD